MTYCTHVNLVIFLNYFTIGQNFVEMYCIGITNIHIPEIHTYNLV